MAFHFNSMDKIDGNKKLKIEFGDSIDWFEVDLNCVVEFLTAAYNKV